MTGAVYIGRAGILIAAVTTSGRASAAKGPPPADFVPPTSNFHLRAAFDTEPSVYLGRFIQDGRGEVYETTERKTSCSGFIAIRQVRGGNVQYDEVFQASASASEGDPDDTDPSLRANASDDGQDSGTDSGVDSGGTAR